MFIPKFLSTVQKLHLRNVLIERRLIMSGFDASGILEIVESIVVLWPLCAG